MGHVGRKLPSFYGYDQVLAHAERFRRVSRRRPRRSRVGSVEIGMLLGRSFETIEMNWGLPLWRTREVRRKARLSSAYYTI